MRRRRSFWIGGHFSVVRTTYNLYLHCMKTLPTTIRKNGFTYEQISRTDDVALFVQRYDELATIIGHEVFYINKCKTREIQGNVIEAHEAMPGDNQFGVTAWSVGRDVVRAHEKYAELCSRERRIK